MMYLLANHNLIPFDFLYFTYNHCSNIRENGPPNDSGTIRTFDFIAVGMELKEVCHRGWL